MSNTSETFAKVTIVGAGSVGSAAAALIAQAGIADVVLIDVAGGQARGKALDLGQMSAITPLRTRIAGTGDYADTAGSDVIIITAGVARTSGMSHEEMVTVNTSIVCEVIDQARAVSHGALILCVTSPLDIMTALAQRCSGLPKERVFGMGGLLDSARFAYNIAAALDVPLAEIEALVVGAHGEGMVPLVDEATVGGRPLLEVASPEQVTAIVEHTLRGGSEIAALLQTGSASFAPSAAIAKMVGACLTESDEVISACAWVEGAYGQTGIYLNVPVRLGPEGVREIVELEISPTERAALTASAASLAARLDEAGLH